MGYFKRDSAGIAKILKSPEVAIVLGRLGEQVAGEIHARHTELDPGVHHGVTDRATVVVAVAGGAELQATEGLFTRAAASAGLQVRSR